MLIAIAGGIGSGKSQVSYMLKILGEVVIISDDINRALLKEPKYIEELEKHFPQAVKNNVLDKQLLRNIIFNNEDKRKLLNSIAHPHITERIKKEVKKYKKLNVFVEVPLLIEANLSGLFDKIWLVECPVELRIERIIHRDKITKEEALKIINAQKDEEAVKAIADKVINNSYSKDVLFDDIKKMLAEVGGQPCS